MFQQMTWVAKAVAFVLLIMSMWSLGVGIERFFTYQQARNQSKLYAPQVAKHLKEGRLKDAIALSSSKNYRYSHLAKVVLAGLQEYQFQQESGGAMSREDLMDTVRRSIQRASALTASDLKKGISALATIGSTAPFVGLLGTVVGVITAFQGIAASGSGGIGAVSAGIAEALVETAPRPPEPVAAMPWNAVMMPTTVPSSPTNGAVAPMVASAATPFLRSFAVSAEARWMARRTVSTRSSRLRLPPASCWN